MTGEMPPWRVVGDWFDVCSCFVPCPCSFNEAPDGERCEVVFAYHIRTGHFGDVSLAGLNVVIIGAFDGNLYKGDKIDVCAFFDNRATPEQLRALQLIFTGQAGGWQQQYIPAILGELKGAETAQIRIEIDDDLSAWRVEIPDILKASSEAITGPTADPNRRVHVYNIPTSEVGPGSSPMTLGKVVDAAWKAFGFDTTLAPGRNSKHIPFEWAEPGAAP